MLYVDHGTDFTSTHVAQVAADLRMRLVHSAVARPQGRGKIERLFGSINTELLAELPGRLAGGKPVTPPRLTLSELDAAVRAFVVGRYNTRPHPAIGATPNAAWIAEGWLPRMPDRLEDLDELLVLIARPRVVGRDGIRFGGLRYLDPTLAAFVGERVTIRHDPRDVAEIRVYHRDRLPRAGRLMPSTQTAPYRCATCRPPAASAARPCARGSTSASPRSRPRRTLGRGRMRRWVRNPPPSGGALV